MGMILTDEQQAILDGSRGETMAKVMKTLVMFGEAFHAEKMVPVTSRYNHLVTSFGLGVLQPVYDLMQQLIDASAVSGQKFSADPRPLDPNVPANLLQQLVFKKFMYNKQDFYEGQLQKLGLMDKDAFTCTPAICLRSATSRRRARSSPGRNRPPSSTPTRCSARAATEIPAFWTSWARSWAMFPILVF